MNGKRFRHDAEWMELLENIELCHNKHQQMVAVEQEIKAVYETSMQAEREAYRLQTDIQKLLRELDNVLRR